MEEDEQAYPLMEPEAEVLELQDIDIGGAEKLLLSASSVSTKSAARRKQHAPFGKSNHSRNDESVEEKHVPRYLRKTVSSQAKQKVRTEPATTGWYCRSSASSK